MNVKTIVDQLCARPAVPASSHFAARLAERWRLSDFFELTKPRVYGGQDARRVQRAPGRYTGPVSRELPAFRKRRCGSMIGTLPY
jgi:hypothetical protein